MTGGGSIALGGTGTLSVDQSVVQQRVSGSCSVGQSIAAIATDGTVTCAGGSVIGGTVLALGQVRSGSGFTVSHTITGVYIIHFPPGTWSGGAIPAVTVTPAGSFNVFANDGGGSSSDGSATVDIHESSTAGSETPTDGPFTFIATQT